MKFTKYDAGTPCWADLMVQDLDKAKSFYQSLFGWEMVTDPNPDFGGYTTGEINGEPICGLMGAMSPDQPSAWGIHLATGNIDESLKKVVDNGGQIIVDKMVVGTHGTFATIQDPQGAFVSLWQAGTMIGSTIANEVNTICWDELATSDLPAAKKFYEAVFNYETTEGSNDDYWQFAVNGEVRGGMRALSENESGMPSCWALYFRVANLETSTQIIESCGGKVITPKMNFEKIEFQAFTDPQGAVFTICEYEG